MCSTVAALAGEWLQLVGIIVLYLAMRLIYLRMHHQLRLINNAHVQ